MAFRRSLFLQSFLHSNSLQLILVGWLHLSALQSDVYLPASFCSQVLSKKSDALGGGIRIEWMLCANLLNWFIMADLGQVTPFNASVPHLSNGGNNTDLPHHRGVVRHCKSELIEYLRVLAGGCFELKSRPDTGFSPHWAVPRLELLSDLRKFSAPPTPHQSC